MWQKKHQEMFVLITFFVPPHLDGYSPTYLLGFNSEEKNFLLFNFDPFIYLDKCRFKQKTKGGLDS